MGNNLVKITDFTTYNKLFIQLFKDKTNFIKIQDILADQVQDIEDAIFEFIDEFNLDNAIGAQLDVIGRWVDISREGRNDSDYRDIIKTKIVINSGSGEHEIIIELVTGIFGANKVQLLYLGNANLQVWADISLTTDNYKQLLETIMAGVGLILVAGSGNPFVFFDDPDGAGFSYLIADTLDIDSGTGVEKLNIDSGTGTEELFVFNWQDLEYFEIDFGSGVELFSIDFGSGLEYFEVNFTSTMFGSQSTEGGEYQSVLVV
jgi:hypothetical protein